jgi:HTH-type transcriptional regulator/antitoxin HipB
MNVQARSLEMVQRRRQRLEVHGRAARSASLARAVRRRREDLGLRQDELAELAGVSERFVHAVETAKATIQLDKLLDVLEALGLHLEVAAGIRGGIVDPLEAQEQAQEPRADG